MLLKLLENATSLAEAAAERAAAAMEAAIKTDNRCRIVVATGGSQFLFLEKLTARRDIDWAKVEAFHLDEYVGLPMTHRGSFRKMLMERVVRPAGIQKYHFVEGDAADVTAAIRKLGTILNSAPIDLAFVGIGENGHIAFNDPPADFETEEPYIVVELDEACRKQQVGEGWFESFAQVATRAVSMSVRQILSAREIIAVVPDQRKARAVKACLEGQISPMVPASILRRHPNTTLYLDRNSASLLSPGLLQELERKSQVTITSR
jgi:glucosamine-6-phosphate deaminase